MELELVLDFVGKGLRKINSDVEKLRSDQFNQEDILDNLSSEIIMLENHIQYFYQLIQPVNQEENDGSQPQDDNQPQYGTAPQNGTPPQEGTVTQPQNGTSSQDGTETPPQNGTPPQDGTEAPPQNGTPPQEGTETQPQVFTLEQLAQYNGKDGNPAYVAVNGVVYNVTNNPLWAGGNHFFGLTAGRNLTSEFQMCHPGAMVLSVLPIVGTLETTTQ
jgi:predicted heme/steroid binding protein